VAPLRALALACILALPSCPALAAEQAPAAIVPGREAPAAAAAPAAYRFRWDEYVSLVVVSDTEVGAQALRRPAWVVTYDQAGSVVVGYRATAFRDRVGNLHIDARKAIITGPQNENWSPDSFAITAAGEVLSIDDRDSANSGSLTETTAASAGEVYRTLLRIAMAIVNEMS
jgi:hypothetical protein